MSTYLVKIDAYSHIAPTRYKDALEKISPKAAAYMIDPFPPSTIWTGGSASWTGMRVSSR